MNYLTLNVRVEGTPMLPLPTPDKLLSDNYMLEGEMVDFKERFKGRKMSELSIGKNTQRLCWGKGAEGGK